MQKNPPQRRQPAAERSLPFCYEVPNQVSDIACCLYCSHEHAAQAVPTALGGIRDAGDYSPPAVVNFLLSVLEQGLPSGGALYDEDACTARCLAALGMLRPQDPQVKLACWSLD